MSSGLTLGVLLTATVLAGNGCKAGAPFGLGGDDADNSSTTKASAGAEITETGHLFSRVFDRPYLTRLNDALPTKGTVPEEKIPYSGWYYPWVDRGTAAGFANGDASALTLYDRAFYPGQSRAQAWETANHVAQQGTDDAQWFGHCNGWSAAAIRHAEPRRAVTKNGQTFKPHHIKALLAEINMNARTNRYLAGTLCKASAPTSPTDRANPEVMGACEDVNPGTFHLTLANWLGVAGHPIVFDMSANYQLWNYPVYDFQATTKEIDKSWAEYYITGRRRSTYRFNPAAERFFFVSTTVTYAKTTEGEPTYGSPPTRVTGKWPFYYVLETSKDGTIVGGEWAQQSQSKHPDFVWVPFETTTYDGKIFNGNPHLDATEVLRLWAESIGADPNNPPSDIREPVPVGSWGQYADFSAFLDGSSTGSSFLGKPVKLLLRRGARLMGDVTLEMTLNGRRLQPISARGSNDLSATLSPVPGMNELRFVWRHGATTITSDTARFNAVR